MKSSTRYSLDLSAYFKLTPLILSVTGALLTAAPAHADSGIVVNAGVAICCFATADNTARTVGAAGHLNTNILASRNFSPNYDPVYGAVVSLTTNDPTNLQSGGVSTIFPGLTGKYPYLQGANGVASASADLGTGQIHVLASSERGDLTTIITPPGATPPRNFLTDYYSGATADGRFSTDFQVNNPTSSDIFLPVSWRVDGAFGGTALPIQLSSFMDIDADFGAKGFTVGGLDYEVDPATGQISTVGQGDQSFIDSFKVFDLGGDSRLMTGLFDIKPGHGDGTIVGQTKLVCWQGATCDYSHTSSLSFGALPDGVTISFDAPGFLNGYGSAKTTGGVPEPATWAMMLVGLGGAGAVLRRVRRRANGAALTA